MSAVATCTTPGPIVRLLEALAKDLDTSLAERIPEAGAAVQRAHNARARAGELAQRVPAEMSAAAEQAAIRQHVLAGGPAPTIRPPSLVEADRQAAEQSAQTARSAAVEADQAAVRALLDDEVVTGLLAPWNDWCWSEARALLKAHPRVGAAYDPTLASRKGYPQAHRDFGQLADRHAQVRQLHTRATASPAGWSNYLLFVRGFAPWTEAFPRRQLGFTALPVYDPGGAIGYYPFPAPPLPWPDPATQPRGFLAWLCQRPDRWTPTRRERHQRTSELAPNRPDW